MRLCAPALLGVAVTAALLSSPAHAADRPACATPDNRAFPLSTRIHGGPDAYQAGGGYADWSLDLTNTTRRTCSRIHPVLVLVDDKRALRPAQPRLEFYDGDGHPHPVRFEYTDEDELVGAFDDGFPGFTVGAGKTLTVRVRLALTSDAVANRVTANAAVVQRHDDDGDWVGQSNDYRFRVETETDGDADTPAGTSTDAAGRTQPEPGRSAGVAPDGELSLTDELARTGLDTVGGAVAGAVLLLVAGGGVVLVVRRR